MSESIPTTAYAFKCAVCTKIHVSAEESVARHLADRCCTCENEKCETKCKLQAVPTYSRGTWHLCPKCAHKTSIREAHARAARWGKKAEELRTELAVAEQAYRDALATEATLKITKVA